MRNYYSDEDYVTAEYVLYNDLDTSLLPGVPEDDICVDFKMVEQVLTKEEKWIDLEQYKGAGYILTNKGRVINTRRFNILRPTITASGVHLYVYQDKLPIKDIFKKEGWRWDVKEIKKHYDDNGWYYRTL
jgi:hypothetical protein